MTFFTFVFGGLADDYYLSFMYFCQRKVYPCVLSLCFRLCNTFSEVAILDTNPRFELCSDVVRVWFCALYE